MSGFLTFDQLPPDFVREVTDKKTRQATEDAWRQARLGKITGSCFPKVKMSAKGQWSETAETYLFGLVSEWLTGQPSDIFNSTATNWGVEHEQDALDRYEKTFQVEVRKGIFHRAKGFKFVGATPDGLIGEDGIVEAKCPYTPKNHVRTIMRKTVPEEYQDQVDGHLLVTGRKWCDFISYDPRVKDEHLQFVVVRVERDEERIEALRQRLIAFENKLITTLNDLGVQTDEEIRMS